MEMVILHVQASPFLSFDSLIEATEPVLMAVMT